MEHRVEQVGNNAYPHRTYMNELHLMTDHVEKSQAGEEVGRLVWVIRNAL